MTDPKDTLQRYLQNHREAMLWKLEGLDDRAVRWPMTPTGTNLLGLVKHLANVELGYFGDTFGRPHGETLTWDDPEAGDNDDLWATAEEAREDIIAFYQRAWAHADATIAALDLDSTGQVPWWPEDGREVTLHQILVHVTVDRLGGLRRAAARGRRAVPGQPLTQQACLPAPAGPRPPLAPRPVPGQFTRFSYTGCSG